MKLLIDSDVFCKLALGRLLEDSAGIFQIELSECARLPALPHMLRQGRLRKILGASNSDALIPVVNSVPSLVKPSDVWVDKLAHVPAIDPGEAQIFAVAAERRLMVMSGDKRALRELQGVEDFAERLAGRIVGFEVILIALCNRLGPEEVRQRIQPLIAVDHVVHVCFSEANTDPREGLWSYHRSLVAELDRLTLWNPHPGEEDRPKREE